MSKKKIGFIIILLVSVLLLFSASANASGWTKVDDHLMFWEGDTIDTAKKGIQTIEGKIYPFSSEGYLEGNGTIQLIGEDYYLIDSTNTLQYNWQIVNGKKYYFDSDSGMALRGKYFWYYLMPWLRKYNNFRSTGEYYASWNIDGTWYVFDNKGALLLNTWYNNYYADSEGKTLNGYFKVGDNYYFFNEYGHIQYGFLNIYDSIHYFDPAEVRGWKNIDSYWYYFDTDNGIMQTGNIELDGIMYSFDTVGRLVSPDTPHIHTLTAHTKEDATCITTGLEAYWNCNVCGKLFSDAEAMTEIDAPIVIPALGHNLEHHDAQAATCITAGNTEYWHCTKCGKYFSDSAAKYEIALVDTMISVTEHTVVIDPAVAPTQTQSGLTEGQHCPVCGKIIVAQEAVPADPESPIIDKGYCGNEMTWTLYNTGLLTISGSGEMTSHPWSSNTVKSVVIDNGISNIVSGAFRDSSKLGSISIPESVISIGTGAFWGCSSLKNIVLPSNITIINDYCFFNCDHLESIIIPNGVTSIGFRAFSCCGNLSSVTLPDSITAIGKDTFNCCGLEEIKIPKGLTTINDGVFGYCTKLKSVDIPSGIVSIGDSAFEFCRSLTSITVADTVTEIGYRAFLNSSISKVLLPDSVDYVGLEAFNENVIIICSSGSYSEQWAIENKCIAHTAHTIKTDAFIAPTYDTTGLTEGSYCLVCGEVFSYQLEIPALKDMSILQLPSSLETVKMEAFVNLSCQSIIIPDGCTTIEERAFAECTNLLYVKIPSSVKSYPANAFEGCNENLVIDWEGH